MMSSTADRQAFLIVTPVISKHVLKLYHRLTTATEGTGDVYLLHHTAGTQSSYVKDGVNVETFSNDILHNLGYKAIRNTLVPGSNHFPILNFFLRHPEYAYYWCIEDDVTFTGTWKHFFSEVSTKLTYDFITSHIRGYRSKPDWYWWDSFRPVDVPYMREVLLKSFNPVYRISHAALTFLDQALKKGSSGHHEVLVPSMLHANGFTLADLSEEENQLTPHLSLCSLRTMRWKPVFLMPGGKKNKLYHPVKARITFNDLIDYVEKTVKNKKRYLA